MAKSSKQDALPGMADRKLKDLHDCALEYAEARDERQAIGAREVELKQKLLDLMHKHKKEEYTYEGRAYQHRPRGRNRQGSHQGSEI